MGEGKKVWIFPDGDLPKPDESLNIKAHEALMVLNTSDKNAHLNLTFYFEDINPIENIAILVEAKRVKCIRIDKPKDIAGVKIPYNTQYALKVISDVKIVATLGRLDTSSEKMSFYTGGWYCY